MVNRLRLQVLVAGIGFLAIAVSLAYFLLAVPRQSEPARGGTYVEGLVLDGQAELVPNPLLQINDLSRDVSSLIFSGLTRNEVDGTVKGDISDGWDFQDGGKTWQFHLRNDAFWSDGYPVTARDVLFTVKVIKDPDFASIGPSARALAAIWKDIDVVRYGDYTVKFILKEPWTPFLNYTSFGLLPEHKLGRTPVSDLRKSDFNLSPVGSGPYTLLQGGQARDGVTLNSNSLYYGTKPYIEKIWLRYYPSARAAMSALQTKQLDGVSLVPQEDRSSLANDKTIQELNAPLATNTFLFLNLDKTDRFGQKEVRQAIAYAINRQDLIDQEFSGQAALSNSAILPFLWAYKKDIKTYDYNPSKARDLLENAGWKLNSEGIRIKEGQPLLFTLLTGSATDAEVAQHLRDNLREVGIAVELRTDTSPKELEDDLLNHRYDALLLGTKGVINDPDIYQIWSGGSSFNYSGWKNEQADKLIEKARQILQQDDRKKLYDQWQNLWIDDLPAIPLYYQYYSYAVNSKVQGIQQGYLKVMNDPSDRFKDIASRFVISNTKFGD